MSLLVEKSQISQYIKACEELLRAARRYRIFLNIAVEFVDLQQGGRRLSAGATSDTNEIIEASYTREILSKVSSRRRKPVSNTRESIKARLDETSRLHAEVRHLLLKIHGQYHIPSTNGKLYDTWKWPAPTQLPNTTCRGGAKMDLQRLLPEFSNAIDRKIQDCLNNSRVVRRIEPLESRVDLLAAITPSILSSVSRHSRSIRNGATHHQELEGNIDVVPADNDNVDDGSSSTSTRTVRELAPLSQTPPPRVDAPMTSPMVDAEDSMSCGGTAISTMRRHASRGSSVSALREGSVLDVASPERSQEFGEM